MKQKMVLLTTMLGIVILLLVWAFSAPHSTAQSDKGAYPSFIEVGKKYAIPGKCEFKVVQKLGGGWVKAEVMWVMQNQTRPGFINFNAVEAIFPVD